MNFNGNGVVWLVLCILAIIALGIWIVTRVNVQG